MLLRRVVCEDYFGLPNDFFAFLIHIVAPQRVYRMTAEDERE